MAKQNIRVLKEKFSDNKKPNGADFGDLMDSFFHKDSKVGQDTVLGLKEYLTVQSSKRTC